MKKEYVKVISEFDTLGNIRPITIIWHDDTKFDIDRVIESKPRASLKAGGVGIRYTVRIKGTITHLYLEDNRWFVEAK